MRATGRIEALLPLEMIRRVKVVAAKTDQTRSALIEKAIDEHLDCEGARLRAVIQRAATAWCGLEPGVQWEGDIGDAMQAAVAEIQRLRSAVATSTRESLSALLDIEG